MCEDAVIKRRKNTYNRYAQNNYSNEKYTMKKIRKDTLARARDLLEDK